DQVHVIVLDRVVHEPEPPALACLSEAALEFAYEPDRAKRGQPLLHLQRDVTRKTRRERCTHPVRMARARAARAARTRASSTPACALTQFELELPTSPCHDLHCDMQV